MFLSSIGFLRTYLSKPKKTKSLKLITKVIKSLPLPIAWPDKAEKKARWGRGRSGLQQSSGRSKIQGTSNVSWMTFLVEVMKIKGSFSLGFSDGCTSTVMKYLNYKVNVSKELWKASGEPFGNTNYEPLRNGSFPLCETWIYQRLVFNSKPSE